MTRGGRAKRPVRAGPRRPQTLAARMTLFGTVVVLVSLVVAGVLAVVLIRRQSDVTATRNLARLATAAQMTADRADSPQTGQTRVLAAFRTLSILFANIDRQGDVRPGGAKLARDALTSDEVRAVLSGRSLSLRREVNGQNVFIEGRPTANGALVIVQRRSDALGTTDAAIRLLIVALAIALAIGLALAWLFAYTLARPLQRTARGALRLAEGHRDVEVRPEGPREVFEVAAAINALTQSLASSEGRQREFLLSVSHDLRTPLTAITAYAESLADAVVDEQQLSEVGRVMLDESHRLARLVTDLLDLARLDADTYRIDVTEVDLVDLVGRAAAVWSARCANVGVDFRDQIEVPAGTCVVRTDPVRVRQVIDGLCENALRVTPAGRPMVLALHGAIADGAVMEVRDGGPGLNEDDLAVAFDRGALYERYRGVRPVGTGLGLAIVHGLVTRLGGRVAAGHAPEGGAQFSVWLPMSASATTVVATPDVRPVTHAG